MRNDEIAYQKAKRIGAICKESKTLEEAQKKVAEEIPDEDLREVVKSVGAGRGLK